MPFYAHFERKSQNIYRKPKYFQQTLLSNANLFLFCPAYLLPGSHVVFVVTKRKENPWCAIWGQQTVVWFWWTLMLDVVTRICKNTLHLVKINGKIDFYTVATVYSWQTDRFSNIALWLYFLTSLAFSNVLSLLILTTWFQDLSADSRAGSSGRLLWSCYEIWVLVQYEKIRTNVSMIPLRGLWPCLFRW